MIKEISACTAFMTFLMLSCLGITQTAAGDSLDVWIGTGGNQGIYHCEFDTKTGKLSKSRLVTDEMRGPGFLALHPSLDILYAVGSLGGKPIVGAWTIDRDAPDVLLRWIGGVPINDGSACHVSVDQTGRMLMTAQYGGGSVATYRLDDDGSIAEQTALIQQGPGSGVVQDRQDAAHAHWTGFSPDGRFAFVPDLGMDRVVIYRVDIDNATITPHGEGIAIEGGGPRHMKFTPDGKTIYVLNELDLSVSVFGYDADAGSMALVQTIATVPKDELAKEKFSSASEIRVSNDGKFVYSANRGHDTITVFSVASDGRLSVVEREPIRGATPRNFNLSPDGQWLIAAGQDSHTLSVFEILKNGELQYHRQIVSSPSPICVLID